MAIDEWFVPADRGGMNIEAAYHRYLKLTGEPGAAASLVLAEAMAGNKSDDVLTVTEAAEAMGVSDKTIYDLCNSARLKHQRVGRQIRINRADLNKIEQPRQPSRLDRHYR